MMFFVFIMALGFSSLFRPSSLWLLLLLYLKVALLVFASFQARYGRDLAAAWWFGFAAFGWGHVAFNVNPVNSTVISTITPRPASFFDPFDLTGTMAVKLSYCIHPNAYILSASSYALVIREWMTIVVAVVGGFVSLAVALRVRSGRLGQATPID
jgi:hypothetical protein